MAFDRRASFRLMRNSKGLPDCTFVVPGKLREQLAGEIENGVGFRPFRVGEPGQVDSVEQCHDELGEDVIERFRSAFAVVEGDDRGRQIALFELTTWSLRSAEHREVARTQYAAYRATAASVTSAWLAEHNVELPGAPDVLAQFVAALFDGVNLAWLADPDGTRPDEIFALASTLLAQFARDNEDAVR